MSEKLLDNSKLFGNICHLFFRCDYRFVMCPDILTNKI